MRAPQHAAPLKLGRLGNHIGYAVRVAQLAVFEDVNALLVPQGATTARFSILCLVRNNPGVNQTVLADALRTETSRLVLLIDEMEQRGWLVRLAHTMDRRARAIYLTAEGRRKLKILERLVARHERAMIRRLRGSDKATLLRMLRNLAKSL
jgi:DNA-binding MarR family transcriptional regulator